MKLALVLMASFLSAQTHSGGATEALTLHGSGGATGGGSFVSDAAQQQLDDDTDDADEADDDDDDADDAKEADADTRHAFLELLLTGQVDTRSLGDMAPRLSALVANLTAQLNQSHNRSIAGLRAARKIVEECQGSEGNASAQVWSGEVSALADDIPSKQKAVADCRASKPELVNMVESCGATVKALTAARDATCAELDMQNKLPPEVEEECSIEGWREPYWDWLVRMKKFTDDELTRIEAAEVRCNSAKAGLVGPVAECNALKKKLNDKESECMAKSSALDEYACSLDIAVQAMCRQYSACYKAQAKSYGDFVKGTAVEVAQRKNQWRVLERLDCIARTYFDAKGGKASGEDLDQCAKAGENAVTDHLNIDSEAVPDKVACGTPASLAAVVSAAKCGASVATPATATAPVAIF